MMIRFRVLAFAAVSTVLAGCGGGSVPAGVPRAVVNQVPQVVAATPAPGQYAIAPFPVIQEAEICATLSANGAPGVVNSQNPTAGNTLLGIVAWDPTVGSIQTGVLAGATYTPSVAKSVVNHTAAQVYTRTATGSDGATLSFYPSYVGGVKGPGCGFMMELLGSRTLDQWVAGSNNPPHGAQQAIPPAITPTAGAMVFACVVWITRTSASPFGGPVDQSGATGWSQMLVIQSGLGQSEMACEFMNTSATGAPVQPPVLTWTGFGMPYGGNAMLTFSII